MKTLFLKAAPLFFLTSLAFAQEAASTAAPIPQPAEETEKGKTTEDKISLSLSGGTLGSQIKELQAALDKAGFPPLNILISAPEDMPVPWIALRNVTGVDALTFVATAARVELKPVKNIETGRIAGWELWKNTNPGPSTTPPLLDVLSSYSSSLAASRAALAAAQSTTLDQLSSYSSGVNIPDGVVVTPPGWSGTFIQQPGRPPGMAAAGVPAPPLDCTPVPIALPALPPDARMTRVYALGKIGGATAVAELDKTLRDVLEMDNLKPADVKLSFHEKTNVLVVNAEPRAHKLIEELLAALAKQAAEGRGSEAALANLHEQLQVRLAESETSREKMEVTVKKLHIQLAESDANREKAEAVIARLTAELKLLRERKPSQ